MANVLCVLYDDPVEAIRRRTRGTRPEDRALPRRPDHADSRAHRLHAGRAAGQRVGRARAAAVPGGARAPADRDLRQGRARLGVRARAPEAEVVISQPFWPAYLTAERIAKAPKPEARGDRRDRLGPRRSQAAIERGITVAEVTYSNSISVSEHVVMMILALVRNYIPSYQWVVDGRLEHRRLRVARPTTWRGCRSAPSRPGGSARRCCAG